MDHDDDDDIEAARRDPRLRRLLESFDAMSDADQARFLRMSQRVAALPHAVQDELTLEQMRRMMDDDGEFRYN